MSNPYTIPETPTLIRLIQTVTKIESDLSTVPLELHISLECYTRLCFEMASNPHLLPRAEEADLKLAPIYVHGVPVFVDPGLKGSMWMGIVAPNRFRVPIYGGRP
jgi:hypothetical protein